MAAFLRKYATATHVYVPVIKALANDFAVGADWTPAAGDVKVSIDGGAAANIGTLPTAVAMGNGAYWDFTIAVGEVTGAKIIVTVVDAATKAVEDQAFIIETYGNASALHPFDLGTASAAQTGDSYPTVNANLDAQVSSRLATSGYTAPDNSGIATAEAAAASAATAATSAASADSKATNIQGRIPATLTGDGNMKADALAINGAAAAAVRLAISAGQMIPATVDTTVNGSVPTASVFQADDISEAMADFYKGRLVLFTSGDLVGQAAEITAYQRIGGIGEFTVSTMTGAPANDDPFIVI